MIPLLLRIIWQLSPSFLTCAVFWLAVADAEYRYLRSDPKVNWWARTLLLIGVGMNAVVTLANDGRMPVLGKFKPMSLWVVGTGKHLLFLCDRFDGGWAIFSIGDFFIIGGLLLGLVLWFRRILAGGEKSPKSCDFQP